MLDKDGEGVWTLRVSDCEFCWAGIVNPGGLVA